MVTTTENMAAIVGGLKLELHKCPEEENDNFDVTGNFWSYLLWELR